MSNNNYEVGALLTPVKNDRYGRGRDRFEDCLTIILTEVHEDLTVRKLKTFYKKQNGFEWDAYQEDAGWLWNCGTYSRDRSSYKSSVMPVVSTKSAEKPNPVYSVAVLHSLKDGGSDKHTIVFHKTVGLEKTLGSYGLIPMGSNKATLVEENERLMSLIRCSLALLPLYNNLVKEQMKMPEGFTVAMDLKQFPFPFAYVVAQSGRSYQDLVGRIADHSEEELQEKQKVLMADLELVRSRLRDLDKQVGNARGFEAAVPPLYRLQDYQKECKEWVMDNLLLDNERIDHHPRYTTPSNNQLYAWQMLFRGENREHHLNNVWPCFIEVARTLLTHHPELTVAAREEDWTGFPMPIDWNSPKVGGEVHGFIEDLNGEVDCLPSALINQSWIHGYKVGDAVGFGWSQHHQLLSRLLFRLLRDEELCAALLTLPTMKEALQMVWDPSRDTNVKDVGAVLFFGKAGSFGCGNHSGDWERWTQGRAYQGKDTPTINELDWD